MKNHRPNQKGFTLIEALMAMVVFAISAVAVATTFTSGAAVCAEGSRQTLAAKLASDLMEEIFNTRFDDIIDVYHNRQEAKGQMKDAKGDIFTDLNYSNFSRKSICRYYHVGQQTGVENKAFILVTVTVNYGKREIVNITMLIGGSDDESSTIDFL